MTQFAHIHKRMIDVRFDDTVSELHIIIYITSDSVQILLCTVFYSTILAHSK